MRIEAALTLTQWLSPGYPVGAFAYSHGLEQAAAAGWIKTGDDLSAWLTDLLEQGSLRNDAILLRAAYCGVTDADATARAFAASAERLRETVLQGAAFCQTVRDSEGIDLPDLTYPVAVGQAARHLELPVDETVAIYLHAALANLVAGATRMIRLGQTEAQRILKDLRGVVEATTEATQQDGLDDLWSNAWLSDIASMQHETLETRIFRT